MAAKKDPTVQGSRGDTEEPQGIEALGNPWDRAYAPGEHPPNPLDPKNRPPVSPVTDSHIGTMSDPTPRERYTVAGQTDNQEA